MSVSSVSGSSNGGATATTSTAEATKMDFLTLLIAQLTNQDPLNPMEDADFTSQLAQLEQLEQTIQLNSNMTSMNNQTKLQTATAMIGYDVTGLDAKGDTVTGTVVRASQSGDKVYVELSNGVKVEVGSVSNVTGSGSSVGSELASSANAIGMWIEAGYDSAKQEIKGIVQEVTVVDGQVMLKLYGGQSVAWNQVTSMRAPTESESWYILSDSVRQKLENAQTMLGMAVTGTDDKGNAVTGIVSQTQLSSSYDKVYVQLFDGTIVNVDNITDGPRLPTAEEAGRDLVGMQAVGLDEDGNQCSGLVTGAEEREDGVVLLLDNGTHVYYDSLLSLTDPNAAE